MPKHNHTTDTYLTWPRAVSNAQCLLHIPNEAQCTGFKTEAHAYTCTSWYRACEGEGLHNVGWCIALMYWEETEKGNTQITHPPTGIELPADIADNLNVTGFRVCCHSRKVPQESHRNVMCEHYCSYTEIFWTVIVLYSMGITKLQVMILQFTQPLYHGIAV